MASVDTLKDKPKSLQKQGFKGLPALLALGRPLVMGVLNVTPDLFSDGGQFLDPSVAIAHASEMMQAGADMLDIGAEFYAALWRGQAGRRRGRKSAPR